VTDSRLNPNQVNRVLSTFAYVDEVLQGIERLTEARTSPFDAERSDLTDADAEFVRDLVARVRQRLLTALDQLGIARPEPRHSARWRIETSLGFIDIALSELNERTLPGYGAVNPVGAAELTALASGLRDVVALGRSQLHRRPGA